MARVAGLERFVEAQDAVWPAPLAELRAGRKTSHWIWFVFPQLAGLGRSATAQHFGLRDVAEAEAYLAHPILGPRLVEAAGALLSSGRTDPVAVLGSVDALKVRSSMTLFAQVQEPPPIVLEVLDRLYGGTRCPLTEAARGGD